MNIIGVKTNSLISYKFYPKPQCEFCGRRTRDNIVLGQRLNRSQGKKPKGITGISVSVVKCKGCQLIYSDPQPIPFDIQDHYGVPPDSYWKDSYFTYDQSYFRDNIEKAKELANFRSNMTALDIGAGIGKCMISLEKAGFDVTGIEPSESFREMAIEKMGIEKEKIKLGMMEDLEFDPESFDFITFGAVLEHLYSPKLALEKAIKWLKPGGVIQIEVPSSEWLIGKLVNRYFRLIGSNYVTNLSPMHDPYHMHEFSLKSFQVLSKELNYNIVESRVDVATIYFVPRILHSLFRRYMRRTNTGMQLTVWLSKS